MKKSIVFSLVLSLVFSSSAYSFESLDCSSDPVFEANSCNICYHGGEKYEGDYIGLLKDDWVNATDKKRVLYKLEQTMPSLVEFDTQKVTWAYTPSADGFWEYSPEFESIYSEDEDGYVLEPGKKVTWIQSKENYAFQIKKNQAPQGENIGMIVYPLVTHTIYDDDIEIDGNEHKQCVLFKAGSADQKVANDEEQANENTDQAIPVVDASADVKKLPDTGPTQYILLMILAMLFSFWFLKLRKGA